MEPDTMSQEAPLSQECLFAIAQEMATANEELRMGSSPCKIKCRAFDFIKAEITNGKFAASYWKLLYPKTSKYAHTNKFPLDLFEQFTEDVLLQLELSDIYVYRSEELSTAIIKIIFHF